MKKIIIPSLMAAVLVASCSIYHPQAVDVPLVREQGEWRVDASAGMSMLVVPDAITVGATATYGITPWMSGQMHANYGGGQNFYLQAAPGVFRRIGEKAVVEGYIGMGYGGAGYDKESDTSANGAYSGRYTLPYAQVNFGWRDLGPVELAFGMKAGALQPRFEYRGSGSDAPLTEEYSTTNLLLEPQFQFRIGGEHMKFTIRVGFAWLSDVAEGSNHFTYDPLTVSSGLSFNF